MEAATCSTVVRTRMDGPMLVAVAATYPCRNNSSEADRDAFRYSPANSLGMSVSRLQADPYERDKVEVGPSSIPGAGDGVFARADAEAGEVLW